jgi:WS/DGAT/MGAT family acyltransferase
LSDTRQGEEERGHLRRLSGQDALFVYAETPSMPMHTMGTLILDPTGVPGGFDFDRIVATVASRIQRMPPFRQRLLTVPLGLAHPVMVDDPEFRVERHLHRLAVPAPGGMRELAEIVGELAGRLLARDKPLWEMWAVEGLKDGRVALVTKLHHCLVDGASGSSQMANLMDTAPDAPAPEPDAAWSPPPLPSPLALARRSAGRRLVGPLWLGRLLRDSAKGVLARRRAETEVARRSGPRSGALAAAPGTPFSGAITPHRSVAYGSAPLDVVKRVKRAFGVTVNDVVLGASALALRRYLASRNALPDAPLICTVPVSLKTDSEKQEFSNKVTVMSIRLPTHLADPAEVLRAVHRETVDAKQVFQAVDADLVPRWLELTPPLMTTLGARLYSELDLADRVPPMVNVAVSNMMGPPIPLYFGGARVEAIYPMGPVGEGMGLNVTVLSNMGRLDVGVLACREQVPDPWEIADHLADAVQELARLAEKLENA